VSEGVTGEPDRPGKEDPDKLVLRGRPRPVVRFRRGLVIGIAAAASSCLVAVAWLALEPPSFRAAAEPEPAAGGEKAAPDALAHAPSGYAEVPRLGPPLPGDLGRPILARREREVEKLAEPATTERARSAEAERERPLDAEREALRSDLLVPLARKSESGVRVEPGAMSARSGEAFGEHRSAPSPWTLSAGTIIPASLITGLDSSLPGTVLAQVTQHVRDSATGRTILIPQGARLIGRYESDVGAGQRRALLVWQRIVFPDGASVEIEAMPATDRAGYAGVEDRVDLHSGRLLKGIALSTLLGVGTELALGGESELVEAIRESAQQSAARSGEKIVERELDIAPILRVRPGWPVTAIVHRDLVLQPWKG